MCSSNTCRAPGIRLQAITCKNAYIHTHFTVGIWMLEAAFGVNRQFLNAPPEPLIRVNSCRKLNYFAIARRRFISRRNYKRRNDENRFRSTIAWFIAFAQFLCIIFRFRAVSIWAVVGAANEIQFDRNGYVLRFALNSCTKWDGKRAKKKCKYKYKIRIVLALARRECLHFVETQN